jgi:hypothetical protein
MAKIEFPRVVTIYDSKDKAMIKLNSIRFTYGMPAIIRYKDPSGNIRCIFAVGINDGIGTYRIVNSNEQVGYYSAVRFRDETDVEVIERVTSGKEINAGDIFQVVTQKSGKVIDTNTYIYSGKSWEVLVNMINASKIILNIPELGEGLLLNDVLSDILTKISSGNINWDQRGDVIFSSVVGEDDITRIRASLKLYSPSIGEYPNAIIKKNSNELYVPDRSTDITNITNRVADVESAIKNIQDRWKVDNTSLIYDSFTGTYSVGKVDGGEFKL